MDELEWIRKKKMDELMKNMGGMGMQKKITVYSTPTCPFCTMAKQYLKGKGVQFSDIDVAKDKNAALEMVKKSGQMGVPVLDIGGKIIVGFDRAKIDSALI
ncbi:putative Thioredoxin [Candidatus Anstonella stagnisolia]|nr:putative Thioredoxin [Candidatus Anstonella stagnisolia]